VTLPNVLTVVRHGEGDGSGLGAFSGPAYALLTAAVASASLSPATIDVVDFLASDGLDQVLGPLLAGERVTLRRRRAFAPLVEELAGEVRSRVEQDDTSGRARIAFLFGIQRARDLDADLTGLDADPELADALEQVLRDGPEVGIHVWLWADTVSGAARRLSPRMLRECSWRVAGKMSPDDSVSLIGTEQAAELRDRQVLLVNDDRGTATRAISFSPPEPTWLRAVLGGTSSTH
jgi:S-DNA-T family DNA segregation ATPase FtsK/SpoIIIE